MNLKRLLPVLALLPALALFFACASAPETPAEPAPAEQPSADLKAGQAVDPAKPTQASLDALAQAKQAVDDLRTLGQAVGSPDYDGQEWDAAEKQYTEAGGKPSDTKDQVDKLTDEYKKLGETYQGIIDKTANTIAGEKRQAMAEARQAAIDAGIADYGPDYLAKADETAQMAEDSFQKKDYMSAGASADDAVKMYGLLELGCETWELRQKIETDDLVQYDPENFYKADEVALGVLDSYDKGDIPTALDDADEAHLRYSLVYRTGWQDRADDSAEAASVARKTALGAKANVAVKDSFNGAETVYKQAAGFLDQENYPDAVRSYTQAQAAYISAAADALEKRRIADEAMRKAAEKMADSEEKARQAEAVLGGGER